MNKRTAITITIIFITAALMVCLFPPALNALHDGYIYSPYGGSEDPRGSREKMETLKHMRIAFFMTENKLYDGRIILFAKGKIGLTQKQEEKIEDLMLDHEAFSIRNSGEIKIRELRFASYLKSERGKIGREEVGKRIREISEIKTRLIIHYMNHLLDLKAVLTPGQLQKLAALQEKFKKSK